MSDITDASTVVLTQEELEYAAKTIGRDELRLVEARELIKPILIGPTWRKRNDGTWDLPAKTLGWEVAAWCTKYLANITPGKDGKPWEFTLEQLRFLLWWYAVDGTGRFIYRNGVLQRLKGWG